jgi:hypothetical protein
MTPPAPSHLSTGTSSVDARRLAWDIQRGRGNRWIVWVNGFGVYSALARWSAPWERRLLRTPKPDQLVHLMDDLERAYPPYESALDAAKEEAGAEGLGLGPAGTEPTSPPLPSAEAHVPGPSDLKGRLQELPSG